MWLIIATLAAIVWGLNYALDEEIFKSQVSPMTLLAFQAWLGAIVFTLLSFFSTGKSDLMLISSNRAIMWMVIASVLAATLGVYFIAASIQAKNATFAALIEQTYPVFTVMFSYFLFHANYLTKNVIIGGIFIVIGSVVIALD